MATAGVALLLKRDSERVSVIIRFVLKVSARSSSFHQMNSRACSSPVGGAQTPFEASVFFSCQQFGGNNRCGGHRLGSEFKVSNGVHVKAHGGEAP